MSAGRSNKKTSSNGYPKIIWAVWIVLVLIAIWWGQERTFYQDTAYALFRICDLQFPVEHQRWGMAPLLAPAWLAAWLHLPLAIVAAILSLSSVLIAALTSWFIWRVNKNTQLYLLPLFSLLVTGPEWFFLGIAEMVPALCYACLFIAFLLQSDHWKKYQFYLALLFLFLAFHTHPGVLPLLVFVPLFCWTYKKNNLNWVALVVALLLAVFKKYYTSNSSYENEVLARTTDLKNITGLFDSWAWTYFKSSFLHRMAIPLLLFATGLLLLRKQLGLWNWILLVVAAAVATFSVLAIFSIGDSNLMMEKNFAPIVLLLCLPILLLSIKSPGWFKAYLFLAIILCISGIWQRFNFYSFYHERLARIDALLMDKNLKDHEKVYYPASALLPENWGVTWALPYESVLRSIAGGGKIQKIKLYNEAPSKEVLQDSGLFYGAEFAYKIKTDTLNSDYFRFTPNSRYHLVTPEQGVQP